MKILKNYLYNVWYQILSVLLPFITVPYVSRVLGVRNVGVVSFTTANTQYFILLASLGVAVYATREIAYINQSVESVSAFFLEIMILKTILTVVSTLLFLVFIFLSPDSYRRIYLIQLINVVAVVFDISWLYMGMQNFKVTVLRNTIVKLLSATLIFLFVKSASDLGLYIAILAISVLFGNWSMWPYVMKYTKRVSHIHPFVHLKAIVLLFIPQVAIQVFTVMNKTILGVSTTHTQIGLFENSDKLIRLLTAFITASGTVLLPAISELFRKNEFEKISDYMKKGFDLTNFMAFPIVISLIAFGGRFGVLFFGSDFQGIGKIIMILAPTLIFMSWNTVISSQYLLPSRRESIYTMSFVFGAVLNGALNFILDSPWGAIGAAVSALLSEFFVAMYQLFMIRNFFDIKIILVNTLKTVVAAGAMGVMFAVVISKSKAIGYVGLLFALILGGIVYVLLNALMKTTAYIEVHNFFIKRRNNAKQN